MQLQSIIFKTGWQAEIQLFYVKLKFRKNVVIFLTVSINIDWLLSCLMKMRVKCCVFCHHKGHSCYVNIVSYDYIYVCLFMRYGNLKVLYAFKELHVSRLSATPSLKRQNGRGHFYTILIFLRTLNGDIGIFLNFKAKIYGSFRY